MAGKRSSGDPEDRRLLGMLDVEALGAMDSVEDTSMYDTLLSVAEENFKGSGLAFPKPGVDQEPRR